MKTRLFFLCALLACLFLSISLEASSNEGAKIQEEGQPLVFEKGTVSDHPSDLHFGSDPYYQEEKHQYTGDDETGYPRDYDPNQQYYQEGETTYKRVK